MNPCGSAEGAFPQRVASVRLREAQERRRREWPKATRTRRAITVPRTGCKEI